jgi:hypothetical protein
MATVQFTGTGIPTEAFNIDHSLISKELLYGEIRLRTGFPYPTLDAWRSAGMQATAATPTTGSSDLGTRGRTLIIFAHEVDMSAIFYELAAPNTALLAGYYVDKVNAKIAEESLSTVLTSKSAAMRELRTQGVPEQYVDLIRSRLESPAFNHRVAGLCAAVYLTSIILTDANK